MSPDSREVLMPDLSDEAKALLKPEPRIMRPPSQHPLQIDGFLVLLGAVGLVTLGWAAWHYVWWPMHAWIAVVLCLLGAVCAGIGAVLAHRPLQNNPYVDSLRGRWWFHLRFPTRILASVMCLVALVVTGATLAEYRSDYHAPVAETATFGDRVALDHGRYRISIALQDLIERPVGEDLSSQETPYSCWEATFAYVVETRIAHVSRNFRYKGDPYLSHLSSYATSPELTDDTTGQLQQFDRHGSCEYGWAREHHVDGLPVEEEGPLGTFTLGFSLPEGHYPHEIVVGDEDGSHVHFDVNDEEDCLSWEPVRALDEDMHYLELGCEYVIDLDDQEAVALYREVHGYR